MQSFFQVLGILGTFLQFSQDGISSEIEQTNEKLDTQQALHKSFHVWTGGWVKDPLATKGAQETVKQGHNEQLATANEVFQDEKYDSLHRKWRPEGMVLCADTSITCGDLFDPVTALKVESGLWVVDYSMLGIDSEGWTYSKSFAALDQAGEGSAVPHWNSYVRRRKWMPRKTMDGDTLLHA